jgi:mono/diheme cytochrome c family protein
MKRMFFLVAVPCTALFFACTSGTNENDKKESIGQVRDKETADLVKRGQYLVTTTACNDCHSPKIFTPQGPVPDTTRLLSGHPADSKYPPFDMNATKPGQWVQMAPDITAFVGPWGMSFAANLTSDSATGIGAWGEDRFIKAIRTGKHMGDPNGRPIMPPMPWSFFSQMTDEDLKSIYAYLKSLPPINNRVPDPTPPNMLKP